MRRGFTLVELAVVLVILGLLAGGVLAGKALIRAAGLRDVGMSAQQTVRAIHQFRDRYFAYPGDMGNAHAFWGARDGNDGRGADCTDAAADARTCSGNGNRKIEATERFYFWQHLALAGLVEGSYPGYSLADSFTGNIPGVTVPTVKLADAYLTVEWQTWYVRHALWIRGKSSGSILTPTETWNIDSKFDDGMPRSGRWIAEHGGDNSARCFNIPQNRYRVDLNGIDCLFAHMWEQAWP